VRHVLIAVIVIAAIVWIVISNTPPPRPPEVRVIKINATPPVTAAAPPAPAAGLAGIFACPHDAYRTRYGVVVCGVLMVTDQYILMQRGWIWAPNATAVRIAGDISACSVRLGVNTLYLDCAQPVMIAR
jgi:hypothetical protein